MSNTTPVPPTTLQPESLRWLLAHGADPERHDPRFGRPLPMLLGTYGRDAAGKHAYLDVLAELAVPMPDTPPLALHRGRVDILQTHLSRDPGLLARFFSKADVYPSELGLPPDSGLTATPVDGGTLLHLAVEFDDCETSSWLIGKGADVNARSAVVSEGFGGHTPLFHAVVSMGKRHDRLAGLQLRSGADPTIRATFRKQLGSMGELERERMIEYRNVTPTEYARACIEPAWRNEPALAAIARCLSAVS